jgi:hypothetical protein
LTSEDSISVETLSHPLGFVVVPFRIGTLYTLHLVLNTGFVMTCLSPGVRDSLAALGHLRDTGGRFHELHDMSIEVGPVPPLPVRVNSLVARMDAEGMLGLNFLNRFRQVCFDVGTRRLTLRS